MKTQRDAMRAARVRAMLKNPDRYNDEEKAWLEAHRHLVESGPPRSPADRVGVEEPAPKTAKSPHKKKG